MTREWNSAWMDVVDGDNIDYTHAARRMVMAAINWIEEHPDAQPQWQEISTANLLLSLGVVLPEDVDISRVWVTADWRQMIRPISNDAADWFGVIVQACDDDPAKGPSYMMMMKAISCGLLLKNRGWDAFNRFMLSGGSTMTLN